MNKPQFWTLIGLSSVVLLLMIAHIVLLNIASDYQNKLMLAQQAVNQGQAAKQILEKVAGEIGKESVEKNDQELKGLLTRQQITFNPTPAADTTGATTPSTH